MFYKILLFVGVVLMIDYLRRRYLRRTMQQIPLISSIPFIGSPMCLYTLRPDNLFEMWHQYGTRYGKTYSAIVLDLVFVITNDHRIVDSLLSSPANLRKSMLYLMLEPWLGSGLLVSEGKIWQTMRKIITPTFHFKILEQFVEVFDRQCDVLIEKLKPLADGRTVTNIYEPIGLLALDIIAESAMGVTINAQMNSTSKFVKAVNDVTEIISHRIVRVHLAFPPLFKLLAPKMYKTQMKAIQITHEFTERIIADRKMTLQRRATSNRLDDHNQEDFGIKKRMAFMDVLLQSTLDDGKPLPDKQIRDEVNTFMFEGHDTTTSAISFCLYTLSRHGKIQQKLFEEIRSHFGDDLKRRITYADLQQLQYLNGVIKESLRLYPPVPAIARWLEKELRVDDHVTLPAGSNIVVLLYEMMRDPDIFEDPCTFKPERHLDIAGTKANAYINIPFSGGPRNCVGQRFALFEMRTIIIKLLRNYELLPMGEEVQPLVTIVLRSTNGVNLGLKPRIYK